MKRTIWVSLCFVLAGIFFVGTEGSCQSPATTTRVIQLAHVSVETGEDMYHYLATKFAENIKDLSNGRIRIDIMANAQLGGERDVTEGMQLGTVEMAAVANFILGPFLPKAMVFDLPFLFKDYATAYRVLDSDFNKQLEKDLQSKGLKVLAWGHGGFRNVYNNVRPIKEPKDLKGLKIRVPQTPMYIDTWKALGANATAMAWPELFTGLQQKTVDGAENPAALFYTSRFYEVVKYFSQTEHVYVSIPLISSTKLWDKLSPADQVIFEKAAQKAATDQRQFIVKIENTIYKKLEEVGMKINSDVNKKDFKAAVNPVYEKYKKTIGNDIVDGFIALTEK